MRTSLLTAAVTLIPAAALAGGYSAPNLSPADLAMAGSRLAAQDSAAAASANPSALARLQGWNVSAAAAVTDLASSWRDPTGTRAPSLSETETNLVAAPALHVSYGFRLPSDVAVGVGAGLTVPFSANVRWPGTWPGRGEVVTLERRIYAASLVGAIEPLPWIRLGGGLVWHHGTEKLALSVPAVPGETRAELETSGDAFTFDVAAEIEPNERLRIGVDYKHQARMALDGHGHFDNPPPQLGSAGLFDQTVRHQLAIPNVLGVGVSYQALPILLLTGAFTWERYRNYDADVFSGSGGVSITVPRNYHNGYTYRLGAEAGPVNGLKVRLGVLRDLSPTPPEWMHPSIPDADIWAASVGLAYAVLPGLEVSASYFHAWFDETRTCTVSAGTCQPAHVFPGIYSTRANIASVGVTWTTDPLRR